MKKSYCAMCLVMFAVFVILSVNLHADVKPATDSGQPDTVRDIRPEEARQALIEMLDFSSEDPIKRTLFDVKKATIAPSAVGGPWLDIGPWACRLKEHKISLTIGGPPSYFHYEGVLERSRNGKWQARITSGGYVCALPLDAHK